MTDLTIVVVSHETRRLLEACLEAIDRALRRHAELVVETIVVDNGSRDGSVEAALASPVGAKVVALIRNRGFAAAVNIGLRAARGRHVLLLNSDAVIDSDVLVRGVALLDESSDIGVVGAALVHPDGRPQRSVHVFPGLQSELIAEPLLRRWRPRGFSSGVRTTRVHGGPAVREVEAVRGAAFFIRGELIEKVGPLDEGYFFFLEETDYCWRVAAAGYRVVHCEALRVVHQLGASSKRRTPLATRIEYHRSLYRFLERRRGPGVATLARFVRALRTAIGLIGRSLPATLSMRARARWTERWGLLLWHLRGCPAEPGLADALEASRASKSSASPEPSEESSEEPLKERNRS